MQDEIYKTVTTLYQTREAAVSAKKNFAENLANIAHQLKTPITAAFLSLQLMKKETANEYANQIEKQLDRLNRLEESLLMLSKIDAGTLLLKHERVDLYTALNLAAENLNDLLQDSHITIEIPENGCIEFFGDLEWTMEAFINLMKNCMEHSQPDGIVHCDYSDNPLYAEIRIWDLSGRRRPYCGWVGKENQNHYRGRTPFHCHTRKMCIRDSQWPTYGKPIRNWKTTSLRTTSSK